MLETLFYISRNTFKECLREPIFLILLLCSSLFICLLPAMALFVFREQVKMVIDGAMATTLIFGWIAAVLSTSHAINREITQGTALLILSKPVPRPIFILGKILGILALLTIFCIICSLATLVTIRVAKDQFRLDWNLFFIFTGGLALALLVGGIRNFVTKKSFSETAVLSYLLFSIIASVIIYFLPGEGGAQKGFMGEMIPVLFLIYLAVLAMGTLSTALSTYLPLVSNLAVCFMVFTFGLMSDYLFGIPAGEGNIFAQIMYPLVPNWQYFWMADVITAGKHVHSSYVGMMFIYFLCLITIFSSCAILLFQNREIGAGTKV